MKRQIAVAAVLVAQMLFVAGRAFGEPFQYQGVLEVNGQRLTGQVDLQFRLFDQAVGGVQQGVTFGSLETLVDGLVSLTLDFALPIDDRLLYLEISARQGVDPFVTLSNRQPLTPVPQASYALSGSISGITSGAINQNGSNVGIRETVPLAPLHIQRTNIGLDAGSLLSGHATLVLEHTDAVLEIVSNGGGVVSSNIVLREVLPNGDFADAWSLTKRTVGGGSWLDFKYSDGVGQIAERMYPDGRVVFPGGGDVGLGNASGIVVIGDELGLNIGIDGNEIMARNNGAVSGLFLNNDGGDIVLGNGSSNTLIRGDITLIGQLNTTTKTHRKVFSAAAFTPNRSLRFSKVLFETRTILLLGSFDTAYMELDLPDGARITSIRVLVEDSDTKGDMIVKLEQQVLGSVNSIVRGSAATLGTPGELFLSMPLNLVINRTTSGYLITAEVPSNANGFLHILGAEIDYTTDFIE